MRARTCDKMVCILTPYERLETVLHFVGGLVCKGDGAYLRGEDADVLDEMSNPNGQYPCFA